MASEVASKARALGLAAEVVDHAARFVTDSLAPMLSEPAEAFTEDLYFQYVLDEALKTKCSVERTVQPLQESKVDASSMELAEGGSQVAFVASWMRSRPLGLTCLTINGQKVCDEVLVALQQLVAETTTLFDLDLMEGCTLNVLQLNGVEPVASLDLSKKGLRPTSAAIIGACISANPVLESLKCAPLTSPHML